jgi:hypothetical protein
MLASTNRCKENDFGCFGEKSRSIWKWKKGFFNILEKW